jgi:hypothetical protein
LFKVREDVLAETPLTILGQILIEVELGDLKKVGKDLSEILGQRMKIEITVKGGTLILNDSANYQVNMKDAKLQMKHALHQLKLSEEYRVLSEHHKIRLVKVEEKSHYAERRGAVPPPSKSLPYFFPG